MTQLMLVILSSTAYSWSIPIATPQNEPVARSLTSIFVRVNEGGRMFLCTGSAWFL